MWKKKSSQNFYAPLTYTDQFNRLYYLIEGCTVTRFYDRPAQQFSDSGHPWPLLWALWLPSLCPAAFLRFTGVKCIRITVVKTHLCTKNPPHCISRTPVINMVICCPFSASVNGSILLQCRTIGRQWIMNRKGSWRNWEWLILRYVPAIVWRQWENVAQYLEPRTRFEAGTVWTQVRTATAGPNWVGMMNNIAFHLTDSWSCFHRR